VLWCMLKCVLPAFHHNKLTNTWVMHRSKHCHPQLPSTLKSPGCLTHRLIQLTNWQGGGEAWEYSGGAGDRGAGGGEPPGSPRPTGGHYLPAVSIQAGQVLQAAHMHV
jgi:hypothetical protein